MVDTKVCPACAETIKAAAVVCRYCGTGLNGANVAEEEDGTSWTDHLFAGKGRLIWGLASCGLGVVGAFGPWVSALGIDVAGTDGSNDGWIVVGLMVVGGFYLLANGDRRRAGLGALIFGGASSVLTIYDRAHVSRLINEGGGLARALVQIGWGLNLAMVASLSLTLCGLAWFFARADSVPTPLKS
jgi:hypothetical protein